MNPRQRQGLLMIVVSILGMLTTVIAAASWASDVSSQVGPYSTTVRLTEAVQANELITTDMVEVVEIPERWLGDRALHDVDELDGLVALVQMGPGTNLELDTVGRPPVAGPGEREIAIYVNAEGAIGGRVGPGSKVDIVATFEDTEDGSRRSDIVVRKATIVAVGVAETVEDDGGSDLFRTSRTDIVPVTFAISVDSALALAYADAYAEKIKLIAYGQSDDQLRGDRAQSAETAEAVEGSE